MNAYWHNIYHKEDQAGLDSKYSILFKNFFKQSIQIFLDRLDTATSHYTNEHMNIVSMLSPVTSEKFSHHVGKIEAFFTENKFKGFTVNVAFSDSTSHINVEYEAFIRKRNSNEVIKTHEIGNKLLNGLILMREIILYSLIRFEISTGYDHKEMIFSNYASIMDQSSNPTLLMEFDPVEQPVEFFILWIDKNSTIYSILS